MNTTRYSPKRDAILQCLRSTTCHPSAEWVYSQLKPKIPVSYTHLTLPTNSLV